MVPFSHKLCERTGLLQWGHVSMLRARKFLDAAVLAGNPIDSVLEQVRWLPRETISWLPHVCACCTVRSAQSSSETMAWLSFRSGNTSERVEVFLHPSSKD